MELVCPCWVTNNIFFLTKALYLKIQHDNHMETTELRIGNYILDEENEVRQVMELSRTLISTSCDFTLLTSEVKPIPLTEDILIKCGFTKVPLDSNKPEEGYYYSLRLSDDKFCDLSLLSGDKNGIFEVYLFPYDNIRFQYLHQVQNIYQSITGKELLKI